MAHCPHCEREVAVEYRFCPWCAEPLRLKLVELFRGVDDDEHRALRVSRYVQERRVRFSVWDESGTARAAVSLDEDEAARVRHAATLAESEPRRRAARARQALSQSPATKKTQVPSGAMPARQPR